MFTVLLRSQRLRREIGANCKPIVYLPRGSLLLAIRNETNMKKTESDLEALEEPKTNCEI